VGAVDGAPAGMDADERSRLMARASGRHVPAREVRWILDDVASDPGTASSPGARAERFDRLVGRRASGEPLQYVLGRWPFRSVELTVDPRVLIPRPETEHVVTVALAELAADPAVGADGAVCVDLGTGSGAIALSLAVEAREVAGVPALEVWASDRSAAALEVASANLAALSTVVAGAGARVHLVTGSWYAALPGGLVGRVDLLVSNPPYVAEDEIAGLDPGVREWEPVSALVAPDGASGIGGMADIEAIVAGAPPWLRPGGALVVEIAPHQAGAAADAARRAGLAGVRIERDLAGRSRMLVARR